MGPTKRRKKLGVILLSIFVLFVFLFFTGRYFLFREIRKTLEGKLTSLKSEGIDINFESVRLNAWSGKIEIYQLKVKLGPDSLHQHAEASIPYLLVRGVSLIPFITSRSLNIHKIHLQQPTLAYNFRAKLFHDDEKDKGALSNIKIDQISVTDIFLHIKDSTGKDTIANVFGNVDMRQLGLERMQDSLTWQRADLAITNLSVELPTELYSLTIKSLNLSLKDKIFTLDSVKIAPICDRKTFMKRYGKEIDYISAVIPSLHVDGLTLQTYPQQTLSADELSLRFNIKVFRDKRYPFKKFVYTALPSHFLQRMPMRVQANTIRLTDSYVSYEEFPEEGDSSGHIFFDKLNATITGVHNDPAKGRDIVMKASAKFMGSGNLTVNFVFPVDTMKPYKATGSLRNLALVKLNSMLGPAAKARIESGVMTNLKFNFLYNMYRSDGEVELNYENLKISSLRENKNNEQAVSVIKTMLLNAFIIRKDMDEDVPDDKKTGTILFQRDTKRSIFNYWWKSILSGIKSAFNLDKLPIATKKGGKKNTERKNGTKTDR